MFKYGINIDTELNRVEACMLHEPILDYIKKLENKLESYKRIYTSDEELDRITYIFTKRIEEYKQLLDKIVVVERG